MWLSIGNVWKETYDKAPAVQTGRAGLDGICSWISPIKKQHVSLLWPTSMKVCMILELRCEGKIPQGWLKCDHWPDQDLKTFVIAFLFLIIIYLFMLFLPQLSQCSPDPSLEELVAEKFIQIYLHRGCQTFSNTDFYEFVITQQRNKLI